MLRHHLCYLVLHLTPLTQWRDRKDRKANASNVQLFAYRRNNRSHTPTTQTRSINGTAEVCKNSWSFFPKEVRDTIRSSRKERERLFSRPFHVCGMRLAFCCPFKNCTTCYSHIHTFWFRRFSHWPGTGFPSSPSLSLFDSKILSQGPEEVVPIFSRSYSLLPEAGKRLESIQVREWHRCVLMLWSLFALSMEKCAEK